MMTLPLGLMLDVLLAALLLATLAYCFALSRKLDRFRDSQGELHQVIRELAGVTINAERAIKGLKTTADETDAKLSDKLRRARALVEELTLLSAAGARLTAGTRPQAEPPARRSEPMPGEYRRAG
jgi:hypothetical protein